MKRKLLLWVALFVMAVNFTSCVVREHDDYHHHHWHHHHDDDATIIVK